MFAQEPDQTFYAPGSDGGGTRRNIVYVTNKFTYTFEYLSDGQPLCLLVGGRRLGIAIFAITSSHTAILQDRGI